MKGGLTVSKTPTKVTRTEWDALTDDERFYHYGLMERSDEELRELLSLIPNCPVHGTGCIPFAKDWLRTHQQPLLVWPPPLEGRDKWLTLGTSVEFTAPYASVEPPKATVQFMLAALTFAVLSVVGLYLMLKGMGL